MYDEWMGIQIVMSSVLSMTPLAILLLFGLILIILSFGRKHIARPHIFQRGAILYVISLTMPIVIFAAIFLITVSVGLMNQFRGPRDEASLIAILLGFGGSMASIVLFCFSLFQLLLGLMPEKQHRGPTEQQTFYAPPKPSEPHPLD
jgi:hypothetical protein